MQTITINGREYGAGRPCYIIAEMSANHGQKFDHAVALVRAGVLEVVIIPPPAPAPRSLGRQPRRGRLRAGAFWETAAAEKLISSAAVLAFDHGRATLRAAG